MAREKTAGEKTFEQYADENRIRTEYHPLLDHPERPDYLAHTIAGEVLCEVEDFGQGELDELVAAKQAANRVRLRNGTDVGGVAVVAGRDPALRVKRKIAKGVDQLAPYASQYPTVAILYNPGRIVDLRERFVVWAIDDLLKERGTVPISAVGILESFAPNAAVQGKALRRHHRRDKFRRLSHKEALRSGLQFLQDLAMQYPPSFFDEEHPRLRIYHLPSPPRPVPTTAFVGPFDEQIRLVPESAGLRVVRMKKLWLRVIQGRL